MALRIWCNPKYFPAEVQDVAIATAAAVLDVRGVTLEQIRAAQAHTDRAVDTPQEGDDATDGDAEHEWEDAWFNAIAAAEAVAGVEQTPIGAMLVLDEDDARFGGHSGRLH